MKTRLFSISFLVAVFLAAPFCSFAQYTGTGTFTKITSLAQLTDGYYVVTDESDAFAMNNAHTGSIFPKVDVTPVGGVITNPSVTDVWLIEANGGGHTIFNEDLGKYASYTGSSNNIQVVTSVSGDNQRWTFTYASAKFSAANMAITARKLQYNSSAPRFVCYTSTQKQLQLYKMDAPSSDTEVNFTATTSTLPESGTSVQICASIQNESSSAATTVQIALDGSSTATNGSDFSNSGGTAISFPVTLTFPANSSADQCLTVYMPNDDALIEGDETIVLNLQNAGGGTNAAVGGTAQHTITITDNDNCTTATTTLPYNGIAGDAEFTHDSSNPPASTPQEACATNFRLTYPGSPLTDGSTNFFGTLTQPSNGLASVDWGGEASFQTYIIDVSGVSSVDIETFGSTQGSGFNAGGEYLQWWYTLDGGSQVNIGSSFTGTGSLANTLNGLDVTGVNQLVVGFTFNMNGGSDGIQDMDVTVIETPATPVLNTSIASLTGFYTTSGTASASQNFDLTGTNLSPASGNLTVAAPTGFEVSTNNSSFSPSVSVSYTVGTASQTIYVRIASTASAGSPSGNVSNSGGGATTVNVAVDGVVCPTPSGSFSVGDITILGVSADAPDQFSFVNWVSIPNAAQLSFTDNAWDGSSLLANENTLTWENTTGSAIAPGTVIVITDGSGADLGTATGNLNGLSNSNENVFVYEGSAACPEFIYGFSNVAWITSGSPSTNNTYLPSTLNVANGNIITGTEDNWEFSAPRNDQSSIAAYKPLVNNASNWSGDDNNFTLSSTDFTIASSTPSVEISASAASGSEAAASSITITATASAAVTGNQTVTLSISGTGITSGDYTWTNSGVITITNGNTTGSITFTIVDDASIEGSETAIISFNSGGLSAGLVLGTTTSLDIDIADNDGSVLYSQASGGTNDAIWDIIPNGTGQLATALGGFSEFMDVVVQTGHTVDITVSGPDMKSLTVQNGGKIYANNSLSPEYIDIFGNVVNNGTIGNGNTTDLISFNLKGTAAITFSGNGAYDLGRIRKDAGSTGVVNINSNMNLRFAGAVVYNNNNSSSFDMTIAAGKTVNVLDPIGDVAIDGVDGTAGSERGGSITVNGTLNIANKLYALSNNSSLPCSISIGSVGRIITKDADVNVDGTGFSAFTIASGGKLEINGVLAVKGGTLNSNSGIIINSGATLLHGAGTTGGGGSVSGSVTVKRQGATSNSVFNYWSSPVNSGTVPGNSRYSYNSNLSTQDYGDDQDPDPGWESFSGTMTLGRGYASRGAGLASFLGTPNNGNVPYALAYHAYAPGNTSPGTPFNLVGNPYPGAISASSFVAANSNINGSLYFWDDDLSGGSGYSYTDYAVWNGTGSIGTGAGTTPPNGYVASGQGFMVRALGTGNITFTNSMRVSGPNNLFFKENAEDSKLWLSLEGNGLYNEILVGMLEDATNEEDRLYDAVKVQGNTAVSLAASDAGRDYAIMAFPPPLDEKVVPLTLTVAEAGEFNFNARTMIGFDGYEVWLEDRRVNQWYQLSEGDSVTKQLSAGESNDRFFLHFSRSEPSGIASTDETRIAVYLQDGLLTVFTNENLTGATIDVVAMDGRVAYSMTNNSMQANAPTQMSLSGIASGVYILRISSTNEMLTQRFVKP